MKKLIYPIAAIFALITVASFSSDDCRSACVRKEAKKFQDHKSRTLNNDNELAALSTDDSQPYQNVVIVESEPVAYPMIKLDIFDPSSTESDIQIDIQFSREETTIEVPDILNADEAVTYQFNAENGPELAYQAKQAAY